MLKAGLVGLPNVGKSVLFNALTNSTAEVASYSFSTVKPNVGVVSVPDNRLQALAAIYNPRKITSTAIEFVDLAGLVRGANRGEGLGNQFLSHIRQVDAIVQVVRMFENENIAHVNERIDPLNDIETIDLELVLADLEVVEKRLEKIIKQGKAQKGTSKEQQVLERIKPLLEEGNWARQAKLDEEEQFEIKSLGLLTLKPVIYALNMDELQLAEAEKHIPTDVQEYVKRVNGLLLPISAQLDYEMLELEDNDRQEMLTDLGVEATGIDRLIKATYSLLELITFLTAGEPEVRAWTIKNGTKAQRAAREIHSDIEKGFIRAEVISFDDIIQCGSPAAAKEKGLFRLEGKEYIVKDGDVIHFRFNV